MGQCLATPKANRSDPEGAERESHDGPVDHRLPDRARHGDGRGLRLAGGADRKHGRVTTTASRSARRSRVEQATVERAITVAEDAREYVRYRADYAVAAALDREAVGSGGTGRRPARRRLARRGRRATPRRDTARGRGRGLRPLHDRHRPAAADLEAAPVRLPRAGARARGGAGRRRSTRPANLDPDRWARAADDIRDRIKGLTRWAFLVLIAVLLYTAAEVSTRRAPSTCSLGCRSRRLPAGLVAGLSTVFF